MHCVLEVSQPTDLNRSGGVGAYSPEANPLQKHLYPTYQETQSPGQSRTTIDRPIKNIYYISIATLKWKDPTKTNVKNRSLFFIENQSNTN